MHMVLGKPRGIAHNGRVMAAGLSRVMAAGVSCNVIELDEM